MQIKRFEARDMQEALRLVKKEFGSEAVILSARSIKKNTGMYRFLSKPGVEVTAAIDDTEDNKVNTQGRGNPDSPSQNPYAYEGIVKNTLSKGHSLFKAMSGNSVQSEKREIKPVSYPDHERQKHGTGLSLIYRAMLVQGIAPELASRLVKSLKRCPFMTDCFDINNLKTCLVYAFNDVGIYDAPIELKKGRQVIVAMVGTAGVGKTTIIAKIAAIYALDLDTKVALVTLDDFRIAAVEQLRIYGRIIGVPVETASSKKEFKKVIKKLHWADLILVDTPGINQRDRKGIDKLREILTSVRKIETHLVVTATYRDDNIEEAIEGFGIIPVNRLVFTRMDEALTCGCILNEISRTKIPVSYLSNGPEVPEDFVMDSLDTIADLIIGPKKGKGIFKEGITGRQETTDTDMLDMASKRDEITVTENNGGKRPGAIHYPGLYR